MRPFLSVLFLLVALALNDRGLAVMRLTNESRDGRVSGTKLCFDIVHADPLSESEKASVTNTRGALLCELWVKPYLKLDGRAGVVRSLLRSSGEFRVAFNSTTEVCVDFQREMAELAKAVAQTVDLLAVGELESACAPESEASVLPLNIRAKRSLPVGKRL